MIVGGGWTRASGRLITDVDAGLHEGSGYRIGPPPKVTEHWGDEALEPAGDQDDETTTEQDEQ